jgi:hypothetical protein
MVCRIAYPPEFTVAFGGGADTGSGLGPTEAVAHDPNQTNAVSGCCNAIIAPWGLQAWDRRGSLRWLEINT